MHDTAKAIDALHSIPPDLPRDEWVKVGMGAHAAGVDFDTFDAWSAGAGLRGGSAAFLGACCWRCWGLPSPMRQPFSAAMRNKVPAPTPLPGLMLRHTSRDAAAL